MISRQTYVAPVTAEITLRFLTCTSMLSLSPFQQTVLEQDEMFFQTFPDARSDKQPLSFLPLHPSHSSLAQALDPCFLPQPAYSHSTPPISRSLFRDPPRHPRPSPSSYPRPLDPTSPHDSAWPSFNPTVVGAFVNVTGSATPGPATPPDLTGGRPGIPTHVTTSSNLPQFPSLHLR